jgi:alcohol oxidase
MTMTNFLTYPLSRGAIHITSKDVYADPDFDARFLSDPADLSPQIWAYKKNREIMRRMRCFRGEYAPSHPSFPVGSAASCRGIPFSQQEDNDVGHSTGAIDTISLQKEITGHGNEENIKDIQYTKEDDKAIVQWIRAHLETTFHSLWLHIRR